MTQGHVAAVLVQASFLILPPSDPDLTQTIGTRGPPLILQQATRRAFSCAAPEYSAPVTQGRSRERATAASDSIRFACFSFCFPCRGRVVPATLMRSYGLVGGAQ